MSDRAEGGVEAGRARPGVSRVGLFGGSFDPVHLGHLHAARSAMEARDLDQVVFVPAARPPHKPGRRLASGADRLAMLELAVADEPRWRTSAIELERGGMSYTYDTVVELPGALDLQGPDDPDGPGAGGLELFLILGSDNLEGLPDWHRVEELLKRVHPIVVHREGSAPGLPARVEAELSPAACRRLREGFLSLPPVPLSSTELRRVLFSGSGRDDALPFGVAEYIREHGLYVPD